LAAKDRIARAKEELQRLKEKGEAYEERRKSDEKLTAKGKFLPKETIPAYDLINSALKQAHTSDNPALKSEAEVLKAQFLAMTQGTFAAREVSPLDLRPKASTEPMTPEEARRVVQAQRGFDAVPGRGKLETLEARLKNPEPGDDPEAIKKQIEAMIRAHHGD
jgi:hypothetical protein